MTVSATHAGVFYDGDRHYATEVGGYLREGLERGHRGLVMAPARRVDQLRSVLGRDADEVTYVEDVVAYAPQWNAYRVLLDFASRAPTVRTCAVAEQGLSERVAAELVDYRRLEAAINLVFAEHDVDLLCPYDTSALAPRMLEVGVCSHEQVWVGGALTPNAGFDDPWRVLAGLSAVVPPPPDATTLECRTPADVAAARRLVHARGAEAGIDPDMVSDVALAVTEVMTNALLHGEPPARLHVYVEGATWVCHVTDAGRGPVDPLIGLLPPAQPSDHGYGLWLARQLCAAVDVGNDTSGTHVRLHTRTPVHAL